LCSETAKNALAWFNSLIFNALQLGRRAKKVAKFGRTDKKTPLAVVASGVWFFVAGCRSIAADAANRGGTMLVIVATILDVLLLIIGQTVAFFGKEHLGGVDIQPPLGLVVVNFGVGRLKNVADAKLAHTGQKLAPKDSFGAFGKLALGCFDGGEEVGIFHGFGWLWGCP
jgi:hypothetical protein